MSSRLRKERGSRSFFRVLGELEQREEFLAGLAGAIEDRVNVLDIATGSGYLVRNFLEKSLTVTCVDINHKALVALKKELSSQEKKCTLNYVCADATHLPFKSSAFDFSLSWSALVHIENWQQAVVEMFRVADKVMTLEPKGGYAVRAFRDFNCKHEPSDASEIIEEFNKFGDVQVREGELFIEIRGVK